MNLVSTGLSGLMILEPRVFGDHRGYFLETFNESVFSKLGITNKFVQDNESFSSYGTLRGLHFQRNEFAQAKLVRVVQGKVLDVVVDIRQESDTFGKHFTCELSEENKKMLMIPRGFAHGFLVLSETAIFQYKCDNFYNPSEELGIIYNDPDLNIDWKLSSEDFKLSEKDRKHPSFQELKRREFK